MRISTACRCADYIVSVFLDGIRTAQKNVSVEPYGSASLDFTVTPKSTGNIKGRIELENDAIELDNKRFFSISIPERVNVAIVAHTPADIQYLTLALQASAGDNNESLLHLQQTNEQQFSLSISALPTFDLRERKQFFFQRRRARQKIRDKRRGLILFPGNDLQLNNYNTMLLSALNIPPIENVTKSLSEQTNLSFDKIDLDHPLFATIYEREQRGKNQSARTVESPSIIDNNNTPAADRQTGTVAHHIE